MSFEKLKNVLDKISQDTNLLKKFREKVSVETVNLLKQNGYNETEEQMQQDILKLLNINEEELELVSGGVNLEMNKFKKISAIALAGLSMSPNFAQSFGADPQKLVSKEQPKNQVVTQKIDTKTENKPNTATDNKNKAPLKPAAPSVSKTNTNKSSSGVPIDFAQIGSFLGVGLLSGFGLTQMFNTFYLNRKQIDEAVAETKKKLEEEQKKVTSLNQEIEKLKNQSSGSSKRNDEKIKELQKQLEKSEEKVKKLEELLKNGNEAQKQLLQKQNELETISADLREQKDLADVWRQKATYFERALTVEDKNQFMANIYYILLTEYTGLNEILLDIINIAFHMCSLGVRCDNGRCSLDEFIKLNIEYFENDIITKKICEKYKNDDKGILSAQSILDLYSNSEMDKVDCSNSLGLAIELVRCVSKILCEKYNTDNEFKRATERLIVLLKMFAKGAPESNFVIAQQQPMKPQPLPQQNRPLNQLQMKPPVPMKNQPMQGQPQMNQNSSFVPLNQLQMKPQPLPQQNQPLNQPQMKPQPLPQQNQPLNQLQMKPQQLPPQNQINQMNQPVMPGSLQNQPMQGQPQMNQNSSFVPLNQLQMQPPVPMKNQLLNQPQPLPPQNQFNPMKPPVPMQNQSLNQLQMQPPVPMKNQLLNQPQPLPQQNQPMQQQPMNPQNQFNSMNQPGMPGLPTFERIENSKPEKEFKKVELK